MNATHPPRVTNLHPVGSGGKPPGGIPPGGIPPGGIPPAVTVFESFFPIWGCDMHKSTWGGGTVPSTSTPSVSSHIHSLCILLSHLEALGSGGIRDMICTKALWVEGHSALRAHIHSLCILLSHLEALGKERCKGCEY